VTVEQERLPRRDWFILPLLSLLSLALVLGLSEAGARIAFPEHLEDRCAVPDPILGLHFQPNCTAEVKSPETPWLENSYNACGFRTAEPCGPKPDQGFRVAVIGSSISSGYLVPYAQTFPARATAVLRQRCHIPVDFQNLAIPGTGLEKALFRVDSALALQPNVVLMALSAHDLEVFRGDQPPSKGPVGAPEESPGLTETVRALAVQLRASRATLIAQHFLYENLDSYLPLYLQHGDEADFLRPPLSTAWQHRLALFDQEVGQITALTQAKGVPFMLVFVPLRAQAALLRWKHLPNGVDPALLGKAIGNIARHHGASYLDLTETIGGRADVTDLYYPVDSHPNGAASTIIADAVATALIAGDDSLAICRDQAQARK
jgi:hypothetical protein